MASVTIVWNAGGDYRLTAEQGAYYRLEGIDTAAYITIDLPTEGMETTAILERLFEETNLYQGEWWDAMQADMPADRHHTALSVGDRVIIDGRSHFCAPMGWETLIERHRRHKARAARWAEAGLL